MNCLWDIKLNHLLVKIPNDHVGNYATHLVQQLMQPLRSTIQHPTHSHGIIALSGIHVSVAHHSSLTSVALYSGSPTALCNDVLGKEDWLSRPISWHWGQVSLWTTCYT